jgi:hypothetical protein
MEHFREETKIRRTFYPKAIDRDFYIKNYKMKNNLIEVSNQFKIEELTERLEFVIDSEAYDDAAWGTEPGTVKVEAKLDPATQKPSASVSYEKMVW